MACLARLREPFRELTSRLNSSGWVVEKSPPLMKSLYREAAFAKARAQSATSNRWNIPDQRRFTQILEGLYRTPSHRPNSEPNRAVFRHPEAEDASILVRAHEEGPGFIVDLFVRLPLVAACSAYRLMFEEAIVGTFTPTNSMVSPRQHGEKASRVLYESEFAAQMNGAYLIDVRDRTSIDLSIEIAKEGSLQGPARINRKIERKQPVFLCAEREEVML